MKEDPKKRNLYKKLSLLAVLAPLLLLGCIGQETEQCPEGLVLDTAENVCCPEGTKYDPGLMTCIDTITVDVCPEGYYFDETTNTCTSVPISVICPEGYYFDANLHSCEIDEGWFTTTPYLTPATTTYQPITTYELPTTTIITACPVGYVIHPQYPEYGCIPLEDAKMLSIGGWTIGGVPVILILGAVVTIGIGLKLRKKKK